MHLEHSHSCPARLVVSVAGLSKPYLVLYTAEFEEGDIMGVGKIRAAPPCKRLPQYNCSSNIVNGLICFYNGEGQGDGCLCRLTTNEILTLPKSSLFSSLAKNTAPRIDLYWRRCML
ncbi:hypothetical protein Droror1_Dr00010032 [Drosera rotundifolia]